MNRSTARILTTHIGSLPRVQSDLSLSDAVAEVVALQRRVGIDVINEGEYTKGGDWLSFADERFAGFRIAERPPGPAIILQGKDREEFADFYAYASARGSLFFEPGDQIKKARKYQVCVAPITYSGHAALIREIELFK